MVVVHVKGEEEERQFLYECSCESGIEEMTDAILEIYNLQSRVQHLSILLRHRLLTNNTSQENSDAVVSISRALSEAETYASKDQVQHRRFLSPHLLRDHIQSVEKEVTISRSLGSLNSELQQLFSELPDQKVHKETTQLSWAGRDLVMAHKLSDYIGKNEKTKEYDSRNERAVCVMHTSILLNFSGCDGCRLNHIF